MFKPIPAETSMISSWFAEPASWGMSVSPSDGADPKSSMDGIAPVKYRHYTPVN